MQNLQVIELNGRRLLTTRQIAECYETTADVIKHNFGGNKKRFTEGRHYVSLRNQELREFKNKVKNVHLVGKTAKVLYLWTEKGALLHAKSLNTDKAWEVYEWLVDFYFRAKEHTATPVPAVSSPPRPHQIPKMSDPILIFRVLLRLAEDNNISVRSFPFSKVKSCLQDKNIGIDESLNLREINFELAYELAHAMVHYECGNIINSPLRKNYDLHAERIAEMILVLLNTKVKLKV